MRWLVVVVLISSLAGCSGGEELDALQDEEGNPLFEVRGVVVDAAIQPVPDARVTMGDQNTTTNTDGEFAFDPVPAGFYLVLVEKTGYFDQVARVTVSESQPPDIVKVRLETDAAGLAYHEAVSLRGFVQCGTYTAPYSFAACGTANVASIILCETSGGEVCLGDVTPDRYITVNWFDTTPTFMNVEMVWDSTQPLGDRMRLLVGSATPEQLQQVTSSVYNDSTEASPVYVTMDREALVESGIGRDAYFLSQTFAAASDLWPCVQELCPGVGATFEQEFELFFHLFHGYEPTPGWRFTDGTPVPPPPA